MANAATPAKRRSLALPPELVEAIDNFRFERRHRTESDALREIIEAGLRALGRAPAPKRRGSTRAG